MPRKAGNLASLGLGEESQVLGGSLVSKALGEKPGVSQGSFVSAALGESPSQSVLETSRYRWNTVINTSVPIGDFDFTDLDGSGGGFDDHVYKFIAFMPDGEIRDMIVGFERVIFGSVLQNVTYGPQDSVEISIVYRDRSLDWLEDFVSTDKETVLAQILVTDDPLKFIDKNSYHLSPSDSSEDNSPVRAMPASVPDYLRGLWLRIRYNTDNSSATNHMLKNVGNIYVTGIFGSYAASSLDFGGPGNGIIA